MYIYIRVGRARHLFDELIFARGARRKKLLRARARESFFVNQRYFSCGGEVSEREKSGDGESLHTYICSISGPA